MKTLKFIKILTLSLVLGASQLMANEQGLLRDAKVYLGIGPNFGLSSLGDIHMGLDFSVHKDGDFHVYVGPYVSMPFRGGFFGGDIDVAMKGVYGIRFDNKMELLPYGKVFVGPSFSSHGTGFNIGFTPGVEFFFTRQVGVYAELGFVHRSYFSKIENAHLPMGSFNLGLVCRF